MLPVIYKRIKGGTVWIYLSKLIPTIWRRNAESNLESSPEIPSSSTITKRDWVKIPTANLTGLRSFIWKSHRTLPGQVTELSTYAEISSANDEYHTHIRVGDSGGVSNKKDRNLGFHAWISDNWTRWHWMRGLVEWAVFVVRLRDSNVLCVKGGGWLPSRKLLHSSRYSGVNL